MEEVYFRSAEPVKIKVERGQRGGVGWEISVKGDDPDAILAQIVELDGRMQESFKKEVDNGGS